MNDAWKAATLATLATIKEPTAEQTLVLKLHQLKNPTGADVTRMNKILRKMHLEERLAALATETRKLVQSDRRSGKSAAKKARDHHLIEVGALLEIAEIDGWPADVIMGAMLQIAGSKDDAAKMEAWRAAGAQTLIARAEAVKAQQAEKRAAKKVAAGEVKSNSNPLLVKGQPPTQQPPGGA